MPDLVIVLALGSALAYGASDFVGGLLARRASAWAVAVVGQSSSAVCTLMLALLVDGAATGVDLRWGALAGLGGGLGTGLLYRGFATGRMSVVAPVSGVGAALVPVLAGAVGGERPTLLVWLGILTALPGIWLVSRTPADPRDTGSRASVALGVRDGVVAGLAFGLLFACLGQVPASAGFAPLAVAQLVSVPTVLLAAVIVRAPWVPREPAARRALLVGPLGCTATGMFLVATHHGMLSVAGVLSSLYPAGTVLLAALVLRERVDRGQGLGLMLCAVAVTCVAAG